MIGLIGKDLEGRGSDFIEVLPRHLPEWTEEIYESLRIAEVPKEIWTEDLQNTSLEPYS